MSDEVHRLDLEGRSLAYRIRGKGFPCLLVCGSGGTLEGFDERVAPVLRASGFQTICYDHRGLGASTYDGQPFSVSDLRDDAIALLEHLDLGPVLLFGISLGALVSQEVTLARPDLVAGATLVASAGRQTELMARNFQVTIDEATGKLDWPDHVRSMFHALQLLSPATLTDEARSREFFGFWSSGRLAVGPAFAQQLEACAAYDGRVDALAAIERPTLFLSFQHDLCTPAAGARELAAVIAGARFVEVADAGHLGFLEKPTETYETCIAFFRDVVASEGRA